MNVRGPIGYAIAAVVGIVGAVLLAVTLGSGSAQERPSASPSAAAFATAEPSPSESTLLTPAPTDSLGVSLLPTVSPEPSPVIPAPTVPVATPRATPVATPRPVATRTPRPTPTPNTAPAIVSFKVPAREDCTNDTAGTIRISWSIARATGVTLSIDGPGVFDSYPGTSGEVDVPFACSRDQLSHTYRLTTTGGSGPAATSTKKTTAAAARIMAFTLGPANCPADSGSVAISFGYEIAAATGVELTRDGALYSTYSGKTRNGLNVVYECANDKQTFVLTTTGGYGTAASDTIVVNRSLP